jgi:uncharacterized membrane-anchored protein
VTFKVGVLAGLLGVLLTTNALIAQKEQVLRAGEVVLMPLIPVDPRSLIQGDYMDLRYDTGPAERDLGEKSPRDGFIVVRLDENRVGGVVRVDRGEPLGPGEIRMRFRRRGERLKIGAEAYHFQEGQAAVFEGAKFGELRVSAQGEVVLVGLRDRERVRLAAEPPPG